MEEKFTIGKEIELDQHRAMVYLPENSVEVVLHAKIYMDGEIAEVATVMSMEEIREAFQKADDGYIDEDDMFYLTEKGKAYLEECKKQ